MKNQLDKTVKCGFWEWAHRHPVALVLIAFLICSALVEFL
jgi:hypothetical protein